MAITMTINADFSTFDEWVEFLKNLSFMGFMSKETKLVAPPPPTATHRPIVTNAPTPAAPAPDELPSDVEPISEQKVNAPEAAPAKTRAKRTPTRDKTPEEQILTLDDLNALVGEAIEKGIELEDIKALIRGLGFISLTRIPQADYHKFALALRDAIAKK